MMRVANHIIPFLCVAVIATSCSYSKKFTQTYYQENEALLQSIQQRYKKLYDKHPFALEIKDRNRQRIGLEIITDSIKYIYSFDERRGNLKDTLRKFRFDEKAVSELINDMQKAHCTWITNLDYYEKGEKKYLVFLSVRHKKLEAFLKPEKYFTLAFFDRPQPFDEKQRLLDRQDKKTLRRINGGIFRKINSTVCYAIAASFR